MSELIKQLYALVGALVLLAVVAPVVIRFVVAVVPGLVAGGAVVVVVRLVWFYTSRD